MDWTDKCDTCAKSGQLINQGIKFACFDDKCEYEPIKAQWDDIVTTSTSGILTLDENNVAISCEEKKWKKK